MDLNLLEINSRRLAETAADAVINLAAEQAALESHLGALRERLDHLTRRGAGAAELADVRLQMARALVGLERGEEAWALGREVLDVFIAHEDLSLRPMPATSSSKPINPNPWRPLARESGWRSPTPWTRTCQWNS